MTKMLLFLTVTVMFIITGNCKTVPTNNIGDVSGYPKDFAWGTATSSYQIEGAWNVDGKGLSIWDTFTRKNPSPIKDGSNGNVACNSYNKYEEDIKLLQDLGVSHYRFSISWPRVIPTGRIADGTNEKGLQYYKNVVTKLKEAGIEPMVTLYHWDLPQSLQDDGGWKNETIIKHFTDYANLMFDQLADKAKLWITFNEPWVSMVLGYGDGYHAPGIKEIGEGVYQVSHILLKAHAAAYRLYKAKNLDGKIGITLNGGFSFPRNKDADDDKAAAERALQFEFGWYANPVFKNGDYPEVMKANILRRSLAQGYNKSRLPEFTEAEKNNIKGTSDFFGLNFYTSSVVEYAPNNNDSKPSYHTDQELRRSADPKWEGSGSDWLKVTPTGFRGVFNWIKKTYGDVPIYVTENGISDRTGTINDAHRISYYKQYLENMRLAITEDKVNIIGYMAWSLMDNFEWAEGYVEMFGLHHVDFSKPDRPRTAKDSARWYRDYIKATKSAEKVARISTLLYMAAFLVTGLVKYF